MGSFTAACSMVRRSGVTFLLIVILFAVSDGRRKFEEISKKCSEYFECVHRSACEQYNQRYAEYKQTNNVEIITELKALIFNKRKRAVCCRQESQESCGKPQKIPESIINGTKTSPGEFPFSGLIGYEKKDVYRGTLASGRRICGDVTTWMCSGVISDTSDTWHLLGILSYGAKECGNGIPGVYTRVSSFLQWISRTRAAME